MSIGDIAALLKRNKQRNRFSERTGHGIYCRSHGRIFVISRPSFFVLYTVYRQGVQTYKTRVNASRPRTHARA